MWRVLFFLGLYGIGSILVPRRKKHETDMPDPDLYYLQFPRRKYLSCHCGSILLTEDEIGGGKDITCPICEEPASHPTDYLNWRYDEPVEDLDEQFLTSRSLEPVVDKIRIEVGKTEYYLKPKDPQDLILFGYLMAQSKYVTKEYGGWPLYMGLDAAGKDQLNIDWFQMLGYDVDGSQEMVLNGLDPTNFGEKQ